MRYVRSAAKCVGFAIAATVLLELILRLGLGLGHPLLYVADTEAAYMPAPNQDLRRFFVHVKTNAYGMRSEAISREKTEGHYRILFIGDSVTFGTTYVDQKEIFTGVVKQWFIENSSTPVDILNASAAGWAPANELGFIRSHLTFNADLVVFVLNTNDIGQPFAPLTMTPQFPVSNPVTAAGELWERYIEPRVFKKMLLGDPGSTASELYPTRSTTARVVGTLAAAKRLTESQGAQFSIIFSPSITDDMDQHGKEWNLAVESLKNWAICENVKILDMSSTYAPYPPSQIYFDGIHLRPLGHQLVAREFVLNFAGNVSHQFEIRRR